MGLRAGNKFKELAGQRHRPQKQNTKPVFMPPLQGGINTIAGAANIPPTDALRIINMIPREYGVAVRRGYREWCPPVPLGTGIRTIMAYGSRTAFIDTSRLFVATNDGIYEATTPGLLPVKVLDWPVKSPDAGYCSWHNYQTLAGQFLLVCDQANGYYVFNGTLNTWALGAPSGPGVPTATNYDFVTVWKNRVWLCQRNTATAWYFDAVGTFAGACKSFDFGNKFKYGGHLKGVWNWTLDGGEGVDDYLVAVSTSGDLVVYKGTDPDTFGDFIMHGSFWIGQTPKGHRIADDYGGDLLVLSAYGLIQLSKLIGGAPLQDPQAQISYKVNPRLSKLLAETDNNYGWEVRLHPRDQLIFINTPKVSGYPDFQFVYNTLTKAWTVFNGLPINTSETFRTMLFMGSTENQLFVYDGHVDNVLLADDGATARTISWEQFGSFQAYGAEATYKRVQLMRPQFIGEVVPAYYIAARYDFDLSQIPGAPTFVGSAAGTWDAGLWDGATWGGDYIVNQPLVGGFGVGRHVALQLRGRSAGETIHVGTDVLFDTGGML